MPWNLSGAFPVETRRPLHDCKPLGLLPWELIFSLKRSSFIWTSIKWSCLICVSYRRDFYHQWNWIPSWYPTSRKTPFSLKDSLHTEWLTLNQPLHPTPWSFVITLMNFGHLSPFLFYRASLIKLCTDPVSSIGDFDSVVKCYKE